MDNTTANSTVAQEPSSTAWATFDGLFLALQVILSALAIIWLGAHASLRRPPSAAPAARKKRKKQRKEDKLVEGFRPSDAIMFPIMAGLTLIGLYYLIKWLKDLAVLNKILRIYLSAMSFVCLGKFCSDGLGLVTTFVFPSTWAGRSTKLYNVDAGNRRLYEIDSQTGTRVLSQHKSPLPGWIGPLVSEKTNSFLWKLRHLLTEEWTIRLAACGCGMTETSVKLDTILGALTATIVIVVYYLTEWLSLSNLLGTALSYFAFTIMSPTSFPIGTMVLAGLFIYDIVMVFYTPYMVTVATKLDVPIKLVYQSHSRSSLLGLGDIVIPGIYIGLALRFDLYQYYMKRKKMVPIELSTETATAIPGQTAMETSVQYREVKQPFEDPRGQWGDRFWTRSVVRNSAAMPDVAAALPPADFPKTYFYAAMAGYTLGMVLTLTMLMVFKHGQPALLYLVPCVTGAVWLTGAMRGELRRIWAYTEDGSLDTEDVVASVKTNVKIMGTLPQKEDKGSEGAEMDTTEEANDDDKKGSVLPVDTTNAAEDYVFLFSITAPRFALAEQD